MERDTFRALEVLEVIENVERHENLRRPRIVRVRPDYFSKYDDVDFFVRFRMKKRTVLHILEKIEHFLEFPDDRNNAVPPIKQLLIALRFYATGDHLLSVGDLGGVSKSTASRILKRVSCAIGTLRHEYITSIPQAEDARCRIQEGFYSIARFPNVLGTIDCTHIKIQSPGGDDGEEFRNRKGYFSINMQTISKSNLEIMDVVTRWPGSTHDSAIFTNSQIHLKFERNFYGTGYLLGDSGYPLKDYLLTPYLNPVTRGERKFNEAHIKTRNTVERQYGLLKRRFPALAVGLRIKLSTAERVIMACCILHNICIRFGDEEPPNEGIITNLDALISGGQITINENQRNQYGSRREYLAQNYFANI